MMFIDWCLIDTLFVSECWAQLHVRFHLTKLGKNFHWKDDEESPDLGDWAFNPWSWNPLPEEIRWAVKKKKRERPTEEKGGPVLRRQAKQTSVEMQSAALQIHRALAVAETWLHKLLLQGPTLGNLGHLSDPFHHLQPSVEPKLLPAKIYLLFSSTECFNCVSRWVRYLNAHARLGHYWNGRYMSTRCHC